MLIEFNSENEFNNYEQCNEVTIIKWIYTYCTDGIPKYINNAPNIDKLDFTKYPNLKELVLEYFISSEDSVLDLSVNSKLESLNLYVKDKDDTSKKRFSDYEIPIKSIIFNDNCKLKNFCCGPLIFNGNLNFIETLKDVLLIYIYGTKFPLFYNGNDSKSFYDPNNFCNIEELFIYGNEIVIDCSFMPKLRKLRCYSAKNIRNCKFLEEIFLEVNTSLIFPDNDDIKSLHNVINLKDGRKKNFGYGKFYKNLWEVNYIVSGIEFIKHVYLNDFGEENFKTFYQFLDKLTNLKTLSIRNSNSMTFDFRKYNLEKIKFEDAGGCIIYCNPSTKIKFKTKYYCGDEGNRVIKNDNDEFLYKIELIVDEIKEIIDNGGNIEKFNELIKTYDRIKSSN